MMTGDESAFRKQADGSHVSERTRTHEELKLGTNVRLLDLKREAFSKVLRTMIEDVYSYNCNKHNKTNKFRQKDQES